MTKTRRRTLRLAAIAAVMAGCGHGAARHTAAPGAAHVTRAPALSVWPPLPATGYITGRAATAADVTAGNAVFAACVGVAGRPLQVAIPQYALWHDSATHSIRPVVVVEAELFDGDSMFGIRRIPGGASAMATVTDLELLGLTPPSLLDPSRRR